MISPQFVTHKNSDWVAAVEPDVSRCCHSCITRPHPPKQVVAGGAVTGRCRGRRCWCEWTECQRGAQRRPQPMSHPVTLNPTLWSKCKKHRTYDDITTPSFGILNQIAVADLIWLHFHSAVRIKLAEKLKRGAFFSISLAVIPPPPLHKTHCAAFIFLSIDVSQAPTSLPVGKSSYVSSSPNSFQLQMKNYTIWCRAVLLRNNDLAFNQGAHMFTLCM